VIIKTSDRGTVRNLTTAASIWVVACLGIVCGAGQWALASAGLALTLLMLVIGGPIENAMRLLILRRRSEVVSTERPRGERPRTGVFRAVDPDDPEG
jgi:putative Mg2+ transporter-C (MgtC) family protein